MSDKEKLIKCFRENVKGQKPAVDGYNKNHKGKKGSWLEKCFGIKPNCENKADIFGFELKNETTSNKTTFGDWSPNEIIYTDSYYKNFFKGTKMKEKQDSFLKIFGSPNKNKNMRHSWSGSSSPKLNRYNELGQILKVEPNNDVIIVYSYSKDLRINKENIIPKELQKEELLIAKWYGENSPSNKKKDKCLKRRLEDKFNDKGWFTCKTGVDGRYEKICFGKPITFEKWIDLVRKGVVFFDSGMYEGNPRRYSMWRAGNNYWNSLITEIYE